MKSIFTKIVVWSCGTLTLSLAALFLLTGFVAQRSERGRGMIPRLQSFELTEARNVYESGGTRAAEVYLTRLNTAFGARHYLLDSSGRDVLTGEDILYISEGGCQ